MSPDQVTQQITAWDRSAKNIEIVSSGATSVVGLTDTKAYRFPTTKDALAIQHYEIALYDQLDGKLSVPIPHVIQVYDTPPCTVITRLKGQHLDTADLASLPADDLRAIIRQLLQFSNTLNQAISPATVQKLEKSCIGNSAHERAWRDYLAHHLKDACFPQQPWLEKLAHEQYAQWQTMTRTTSLPTIVVHDELHTGNLLFADNRVSGIIDFGDTTVGTIAQELRQLFRVSEKAVHMAIDEYGAMTGLVIEFADIATWAITQELASYCRWTAMGDVGRPSYIRSQANLQSLLTGFKG